jgi:Ser-tRNA(Ala) deacylase AlaX
MTRIPFYEREPYRTRLGVEVVGLGESGDRPYVLLDDTLLYPEGGGQPADHGRLGEAVVVDVRRVAGEIRHFVDAPCELGSAGLVLDWQRRYDHMQQHTAQHLLSALALELFGWATRSFHLGPETSDIEFDAPTLTHGNLAELEEAAIAEVANGRPVNARRVSPEDYSQLNVRSRGLPDGHSGDIRLVEIEGIDLNTCGGTHLRSTSEIETIKLLGTERSRGGTRVRWVAGGRVRRRLAAHETRNTELRTLLDSDDGSLVESAALKLEQLTEIRRRLRHVETRLAEARVDSLAESEDRIVVAHFDAAGSAFLQQVARALLERAPTKACLLTADGDKGSFFVVAIGTENSLEAARVGPKVAEALDGRGGGSGAIFQGKASSLEGRAAAEELLRRELAASRS